MAYFSARAFIRDNSTCKEEREEYPLPKKRKEKKERREDFVKVATSDLIRMKRAIINEVGVRLQGNSSGVRDSAVC